MAVGEIPFNDVAPIDGVKIATIEAGVRYPDRKDLVLFELADTSVTSAVFTQNIFAAAPVVVCKEHLATSRPRYLLINTGNANAGTGATGLKHARDICAELAKITAVEGHEILPFSTGVTVEFLKPERIIDNLPRLLPELAPNGWLNAAKGIMTTDTVPKLLGIEFEIDGKPVRINGITKGSGMIKPNMATMLSFIATDAKIAPAELDKILKSAVNKSFNRITVDGDTSTNDSCVLVATGKGAEITGDNLDKFAQKLENLMQTLAQYMVRDGEGATKFITVTVQGGKSTDDCLAVAYEVAHSPLVKTAFFSGDANLGRIMVAIGNAKVPNLDGAKIKMWVGGVRVLANGIDLEYDEAKVAPIMSQDEIEILIDLGQGEYTESVWTCDLSHEYVSINADYRS
jgi:glutamate N-acetyltransferase / amino-acid N-acetyltransferase